MTNGISRTILSLGDVNHVATKGQFVYEVLLLERYSRKDMKAFDWALRKSEASILENKKQYVVERIFRREKQNKVDW